MTTSVLLGHLLKSGLLPKIAVNFKLHELPMFKITNLPILTGPGRQIYVTNMLNRKSALPSQSNWQFEIYFLYSMYLVAGGRVSCVLCGVTQFNPILISATCHPGCHSHRPLKLLPPVRPGNQIRDEHHSRLRDIAQLIMAHSACHHIGGDEQRG